MSQVETRNKQQFELLLELPPDVLNRILFQFCDGKSLSTLALSCSTSLAPCYRCDLLARISTTCRRLFHQLRHDVQRDITGALSQKKYSGMIHNGCSAGCFSWLVQWIHAVDTGTSNINLDSMKQCVLDSTTIDAEMHITMPPKHHKSMRHLSEDLAVVDYLRRRDLERSALQRIDAQLDEWPVWIGPISFRFPTHSDGTLVLKTAHVQILTCGFDRSFPLRELGTTFAVFSGEPANFLPCHPWGQIVGLRPEDDLILCSFALHLNRTDKVGLPWRGHEIKIFSKRQASCRFQLAPSFMRRAMDTRMLKPRYAASVEVYGQVHPQMSDPLICCWDRAESDTDRSGLRNPRQDIDRMIHLMNHTASVVPTERI